MELVPLVILSERGDERILRVVENVKDTFMERQTGAKDRGNHNLCVTGANPCRGERSDDILGTVVQHLA